MAQMQREQEQPEHIKARYKVILEAVNHHRIDIVMAETIRLEQRKSCIGLAEGEMCKVISNKCEHDQPAHHHVARGERRFYILPVLVWLGAGMPVFNRQLDGHVNMNDDRGEQE